MQSKKNNLKYVGLWAETESKAITLPFTIAGIKTVLEWGANPEKSQYTHQDIAHWCCRFYMKMREIDADKAMDIAIDIAEDVDAQWELYMVNSFSLNELRNLDFSKERMPFEWFNNWLEKINKA